MAIDRPTELLEILFDLILQDIDLRKSGLLTSMLRVCSRWKDIGTRPLWTDLAMTPTSLSSFVDGAVSSEHVQLIRSLSLSICPLGVRVKEGCEPNRGPPSWAAYDENPFKVSLEGNAGTQRLWANLERLSLIIERMASLTSFSLLVTKAQSAYFAEPVGFWLRRRELHMILVRLPTTVVDLKLDTKGFDQCYDTDAHLCTQISQRIARASNIRLRLSRMCHAILPEPKSPLYLSSLVINLRQPAFFAGTKICGKPEDGPRRLDTTADVREQCAELRRTLMPILCDVRLASPAVTKLRLLDSVVARDYGGRSMVINLTTRDVMTNMTTSRAAVPLECKYGTEVYALRSEEDCRSEDWCGRMEMLEDGQECSTWTETTQGARIALDTGMGRRKIWADIKKQRVENKEEYMARSGLTCPLWKLEARAGRSLCSGAEYEGFPEVEPLRCVILGLGDDEDDKVSDTGCEKYENEFDLDL